MADENKPAFYPRVGNIKAKNFRSAKPMPFIDDERAMELPQYSENIRGLGRVDLSIPTKENRELNRRISQRDADLMRQVQADRSIPEKLAGGLQAGRFIGSALTQAINSAPTRLFKGDEAADKFIQERIYKPEQPLAYEYAGDIGDFLEKLETEYKIPPVLPEAVALQFLTGPATSQATRAAGRGAEQAGRAMERGMEPVVRGALEQGGLPREMAMAMGANTQSNVVKPYGGNWLGGGEQLGIPENDLRRLKGSTEPRLTHINEQGQAVGPEYGRPMTEEELRVLMSDPFYVSNRAVNNWIDSNLKNYIKKEMGTPDDPVRKLAEQGITHMPLRDDLDRMAYLKAVRKEEGFPAEGMAQSPLAKQWENLADDSIRVTKAGKIQEAADISDRVLQARMEIDAYTKELDKNFLARMGEHVGNKDFSSKEAEILMRMPEIQKAEILGDTKYKELKENLYQLMAREQGFEKRAGELNPFVSKLDPETRLYSGSVYNLGFDHIVDVLREDVAAGRIRPEQLSKVSMEQAVRRTFEYDQELARKMNEARMTSRAELPVYKEYPEGLKWVELNRPGDFAAESDAMGHSVRGYEPPQGHPDWVKGSGEEGHLGYGYGGWEGIKSGRAKVYSLVDAKGEPHVTIETKAPDLRSNYDELQPLQMQADREADAQNFKTFAEREKFVDKRYQELKAQLMAQKKPEGDYTITQIKGKQNAKPKAEYLPFVRDFVQGGNWSDVRDFQNTGLEWRTTGPQGIFMAEDVKALEQAGYKVPKYLTTAEKDDLAGKLYELQTGNDYNTGLPKVPPAEGMKRGGVVISNNPDAMMLELNNQKMKNGEPAYAGGKAIIKKGLQAAKPEAMKASEALGRIEGRPLVITQSDRTKVGEGFLGGPGFSSLQLTEPEYRAAEAAWGVKTPGVAKMILGGGKKAGDNPVYTTMIGSPTQHQSNQMVFDKLYGDFKKAAKKGGLPTELRDKINDRLIRAVDKEGNPVFPSDVDIMDKNFKNIANTFDRRSIAGHLMGGVQVGGKKGQIIDYDKIIRETTDPALIDVPAGSLGNRLFTLSGGIIDRPDLHPAFPTILQGEDLGLSFSPVAKELLMRDFIEKTMREKGRKPGYMDFTRGHPPSQIITEDILTEMQKLGLKEGGAVKKAAGGEITGDDLIIEERPL